jgi:hypothetical protein
VLNKLGYRLLLVTLFQISPFSHLTIPWTDLLIFCYSVNLVNFISDIKFFSRADQACHCIPVFYLEHGGKGWENRTTPSYPLWVRFSLLLAALLMTLMVGDAFLLIECTCCFPHRALYCKVLSCGNLFLGQPLPLTLFCCKPFSRGQGILAVLSSDSARTGPRSLSGKSCIRDSMWHLADSFITAPLSVLPLLLCSYSSAQFSYGLSSLKLILEINLHCVVLSVET